MPNLKPLFSRRTDEWATPSSLYAILDAEFSFQDDPCPLAGTVNGLLRPWLSPTWLNPPYSAIPAWLSAARRHQENGNLIVALLPSRTDTRWFHDIILPHAEIRFIKGRLRFGNAAHNAPFPSLIAILRPTA